MASKTISQRISLEGSEEIKKALEALSAAAAKSAAEVQKAGDSGGDGFTKTGEAAASAASEIDKIGVASQNATGELAKAGEAANKTSESFRGISLEAVKTGAEIAKIGAEIALTGIKIERALTHTDNLFQSLIKLGLHASSAVRSFELLGLALGPVAITLGVIAGAAAGAGVALLALEKAATAAAKGYEELNHQLQMLAQTSGTSFESLQKGSAAFEQMGVKSETARQAVVKLDETLKSFDTGAKIKEATDKLIQSEKELLEAKQRAERVGGERMSFTEQMRLLEINKQLQSSTTELGKANEELGKKQTAFATLAANDLSKVIPLIKQIEEGQKGIKFDEATTAATKLDALNARLKEVKDKTGDARQAFVSIIANAATLKEAIAFGKQAGFSDEDVDRIRRFGGEAGKIPDLFQRLEKSGALIGKGASKSFDDMRTSIQDVQNAWTRLEQAWASTIFAQAGAKISSTLNTIKAGLINFTALVVESFTKIAGQIGTGLGAIGSGWGSIVQMIVAGWGIIGAAVARGVTTAVGGAWQWIATTFNSVVGSLVATASPAAASITTFVTTAVGGAWQWIADTFNSAVAGLGGIASGVVASVTTFVTTTVPGAWEWIKSTFSVAVDGMKTAIDKGKGWVTEFVTTSVPGAWQWIVDKWNAMLSQLGGGKGAAAGGQIGGSAGFASGGLLGGRGTGTSDSNLAWVSRGEFIMPARAVRQPGMLAFLEALRRSGRIPGFAEGGSVGGGGIGGGFGEFKRAIVENTREIEKQSTVIDKLAQNIDSLMQIVRSLGQKVSSLVTEQSELKGAIQDLMSSLKKGGGGESGTAAAPAQPTRPPFDPGRGKGTWAFVNGNWYFSPSHAQGGLLGGRGTGTSDSNLAWVSRGEHIMPARAVSRPGVLAFLEALRRSGGNLRDVIDGMGRFALGGMVRAPVAFGIPAFAGGGMNNVTIQFPGLPDITGLRASSGVVDELRKAAAMAQVRSGGRKPSRYS